MTEITTVNTKTRKNRKHDFTDALAEITDQLRLIDQKITMATDNTIEEEFQTCHQDLYHTAYTINKLEQKQRMKRKKLVHNRFIPNQSQKRLS
ncbi:hypothetical protein [Lentibacillus sp.]|uniref:hypothetical protein n=1 Tax=Lentibacillus sp. TaxID=1925746 RepID=UPI002B4B2262|nr:hypothetical protein [Lentibacillus sp.]HLS08251.1 hypothetical protein [Lentibacillus sp.]